MQGPIANVPNGFSGGITIRGLPIQQCYGGEIFWVNNSTVLARDGVGGSNNNDGSWQEPFATIDYAIGKCKAGRGDIIMVMPGHVEVITAADAILADVANIAIVGTGTGASVPRIDFNNTAATFAVSADDVSIKNIHFRALISAVVVGVNVKAGADDFNIENCRFTAETAGTDEFNHSIRIVGGTNLRPRIDSNIIDMGIAGAVAGIHLDAATDKTYIRNNIIRGDYSSGNILGDTTLSSDVLIEDNLLIQGIAGDIGTVAGIVLLTGTHGVIRNNDIVCNVATPDLSIVADSCFQFGNKYSETVNAEGVNVNAPAIVDSSSNALGADTNNNTFASTNVVSNRDGSLLERSEYIMDQFLALPRCVASSAKTLTTGNVNMFTIAGGPIKVLELVGIVTTVVQSQATSTKVTVTTDSPAATVDFSAAAVDITGAAAGSSIRHINTTGILTVVAAGFVMEGNAFATNDTQYLVPAGTMQVNNASASNTGAITWYMRYVPLAPGVTVV